MRWKEYSKEKPTEEEHQYLVKEVVNNGFMKGLTMFYICGYSKNLSKLDDFEFHGKTSGGFYDCDSEFGYFVINQTKFNKLYWIDLTEVDKEWSKEDEIIDLWNETPNISNVMLPNEVLNALTETEK